jgi:hypothetical protein
VHGSPNCTSIHPANAETLSTLALTISLATLLSRTKVTDPQASCQRSGPQYATQHTPLLDVSFSACNQPSSYSCSAHPSEPLSSTIVLVQEPHPGHISTNDPEGTSSIALPEPRTSRSIFADPQESHTSTVIVSLTGLQAKLECRVAIGVCLYPLEIIHEPSTWCTFPSSGYA